MKNRMTLPDFIGDNGYFSTMFDFNETIFGGSKKGWYDQTPITPNDYRSCCFASQKKIGDIGMLSNIIENHDQRQCPAISRRGNAITQAKNCSPQ